MKVLHVIPSVAETFGGPSRAIRMMEEVLTKKGVYVETATTNDEGVGKKNDTLKNKCINESEVVRWYFNKDSDLYKVSISFYRWISMHVKEYDLVHIHALFSFTSNVAARAAKRAGVPYIIRPFGTLANYGLTQRRPWLKRWFLKIVEEPLLKNAATIHFTSDSEKLQAESLGIPFRSVVIPLGLRDVEQVSAEQILNQYPELRERSSILYLSRLDPVKNVEGLLRAFAICEARKQGASLILAGDGDARYVQNLKTLSRDLKISNDIVWTGWLEGDLKASAFSYADVFVLPSFSENFGVAAAEALMYGLPCVVGEGVAISQQIADGNAGVVVDISAKSIANGIDFLFADQETRRSMAKNAREVALEKFSINSMGDDLFELYSKIIKEVDETPVKNELCDG